MLFPQKYDAAMHNFFFVDFVIFLKYSVVFLGTYRSRMLLACSKRNAVCSFISYAQQKILECFGIIYSLWNENKQIFFRQSLIKFGVI